MLALNEEGLYRSRRVFTSAQGVVIESEGRQLLNFCSNDYLGLANHPDIVTAFKTGAELYGVGSASAHLICGHSIAHQQLEEELADFTGRTRALLFSTGYMANVGVISALLARGDTVLQDRLNHASLLDGGLLSRARLKRYQHLDVGSLQRALAKQTSGKRLIVTDGVFSMDGDCAPLNKLAQTAHDYQAWLMVDDAHGFGVIGKQGQGLVRHYGLTQEQVPVLMGTLGKAFGVFGAFVAGSDALIETLIHRARSYIYTTALPPAFAEAARASLKILRRENWRREKLHSLINYFRQGAQQLGFQLSDSVSAIQPLLLGDNQHALAVSEMLLSKGLLVSAIRPPTVPAGTARLRITFSAQHSKEHVDRLLSGLEGIDNA